MSDAVMQNSININGEAIDQDTLNNITTVLDEINIHIDGGKLNVGGIGLNNYFDGNIDNFPKNPIKPYQWCQFQDSIKGKLSTPTLHIYIRAYDQEQWFIRNELNVSNLSWTHKVILLMVDPIEHDKIKIVKYIIDNNLGTKELKKYLIECGIYKTRSKRMFKNKKETNGETIINDKYSNSLIEISNDYIKFLKLLDTHMNKFSELQLDNIESIIDKVYLITEDIRNKGNNTKTKISNERVNRFSMFVG